jgi:hypothetical protein
MTFLGALTRGLIDYAGLFPPAGLDMRAAVESYAEYRAGPDAAALGRFIVPLERLGEMERCVGEAVRSEVSADPWTLSVLVSGDALAARDHINSFNRFHQQQSANPRLSIDAVEIKRARADEILRDCVALPRTITSYFEVPLDAQLDENLRAIKSCGARAKIRTGGTTADAFPSSSEVLRFMRACHEAGLAFKATAGLHHPLRSNYPLTYEPEAASGTMYGFLNVFLGAALLRAEASDQIVLQLLEETNSSTLKWAENAVSWRDQTVTAEQIETTRADFAVSFGSCSFREPVDELKQVAAQGAAA